MNNHFEKRRGERRRRKLLCHYLIVTSSILGSFLLLHLGSFLPERLVSSSFSFRDVKNPAFTTKSTGIEDNRNNNKTIKTLYWHVGPPKTATTYLQCGLCFHNDDHLRSQERSTVDAVLRQDGLVYLGTCPYAACRRSLAAQKLLTKEEAQLQQNATTFLKHRFGHFFTDLENGTAELFHSMGPVPIADSDDDNNNNHNSIASLSFSTVVIAPQLKQQLQDAYQDPAITAAMLIYEGSHRFGAAHLRVLSQYLQEQHWKVHIIVAYRRLYDWLPSKYNSITKAYAKEEQWPLAATETTTTTSSRLVKNNNNKMMPVTNRDHVVLPFSLVDDRADFSDMIHQIQTSQQHPTETVMRNYQRYFDSVAIWDLHSNNNQTQTNHNLLQQWFCHILQPRKIAYACAWDWQMTNVKGDTATTAATAGNPSVNLDYDMLAVAAYHQGLLPSTAQRRTTSRAIQDHVQRQGVVSTTLYEQIMPQACLPADELQQLYDLSAAVEQRLFAWTVERQEQHLAGFQPSKYCALNVTTALELPFWQSFFQTIHHQ